MESMQHGRMHVDWAYDRGLAAWMIESIYNGRMHVPAGGFTSVSAPTLWGRYFKAVDWAYDRDLAAQIMESMQHGRMHVDWAYDRGLAARMMESMHNGRMHVPADYEPACGHYCCGVLAAGHETRKRWDDGS